MLVDIDLGIKMMMISAPALAGVLHVLRYRLVCDYHVRLWDDPWSAPANRVERRHLHRACGECSLISEMVTSWLA